MKIGLYGGMANNMYVFAKSIHDQGVDTCFIRDRSDHYPFSQPAWEDVELTLPYKQVPESVQWSWERWEEVERDAGWLQPDWVFDPLTAPVDAARRPNFKSESLLDRYWLQKYLSAPHRAATLQKMCECDALLVCGFEGSTLARLSGRPFIIWPHGGDMMIAAGMLKPPMYKLRQWIVHGIMARQMRAAFGQAVCVGNHEPSGITSAYWGAERYIQGLNVVFMPIPIPLRERQNPARRHEQMASLLARVGLQVEGLPVIGFIPSRVDYEWKGQDRLLEAAARLQYKLRSANVKLLFSGWGKDLDNAKCLTRERGIDDIVLFMDVALSKPLLYKFYQAADFVVDQFTLGMYGTAALETMASGCPLMIWLNQEYSRSWGAPPVMNVRTVNDIAVELEAIIDGERDLEAMSVALQEWMGRIHGPARVASQITAIFSQPSQMEKGWQVELSCKSKESDC